MKSVHLLVPVLALAVAGGWLGVQRASITTVRTETVALRERIGDWRRAGAPGGDSSLAARIARGKEAAAGGPDWRQVANRLAAAGGGGPDDMRAMMRLQKQLLEMSAEQLAAALDEVAALELPENVRLQLEGMLVGPLVEKDPQLVLERFGDRIGDDRGGLEWQLAQALRKLAGTDSAAALQWLDRQVAAGVFESKALDGRSGTRSRFEAALLAELIKDDPAACGRRLDALPAEQRRDVFNHGMFFPAEPGSEVALAGLIRNHLPEGDRIGALSPTTNALVGRGGYQQVGEFLDRIDASPEERRGIAAEAAMTRLQTDLRGNPADRAAVDRMREWLATQAPAAVDRITGEALAGRWADRDRFEQAVRMVTELHAEAPGDDLLVSFLQSPPARAHADLALPLLERLADDARREEIRSRLQPPGE